MKSHSHGLSCCCRPLSQSRSSVRGHPFLGASNKRAKLVILHIDGLKDQVCECVGGVGGVRACRVGENISYQMKRGGAFGETLQSSLENCRSVTVLYMLYELLVWSCTFTRLLTTCVYCLQVCQ